MIPKSLKKIKDKANTTVYVAMSGGVDSSVSAALLKESGFDVVGCFMTVWQPPFLDCSMESERQDAMRVAAHLDIPFETVDLADEYKTWVVDYMIREYKAGRTPNPDVMCNGEIKFGAFFDWAKDAGADFVATGHYAQTDHDGEYTKLLAGKDTRKDQTYFLWQIAQGRLQDTLFPIGHLEKTRVRELAAEYGIQVADKEDSQGLCFLGQVNMQDFLKEFIEADEGAVVNEAGEKIGTHDGAVLYTTGQRRGFTVTKKAPDSGPFYVSDRDVGKNTITVTEDNSETGPVFNAQEIALADVNWIAPEPRVGEYKARIRYNQPLMNCELKKENGAWQVLFEKPLRAVATGQSCVIYEDGECLGGGIIESIK